MESIFNNCLSLVGRFELVGEPETLNESGYIKAGEVYPIAVFPEYDRELWCSFSEATIGDVFDSVVIQKYRAMKEVSWGEYESNPEEPIFSRVIKYTKSPLIEEVQYCVNNLGMSYEEAFQEWDL